MAIIALIASQQVNEPFNYLNDVIEVFDDDHTFTQYELDNFQFLTINGSRADVEAKVEQIKPTIAVAVKNSQGKWTFDYSQGTGEEIEVWSNLLPPINWYEYNESFKYPLNVEELTAEEKQLLATLDINHPSVDSAIKKIVKDLSVLQTNNTEIKELKGDMPS
jgi:hypothetical protein